MAQRFPPTTDVEIVTEVERCLEIVKTLQTERKHVSLALDCEGYRFGSPEGQFFMVQVATEYNQCYLFDIYTNDKLMRDGGLIEMLSNIEILKIMHSCRGDCSVLYHKYGKMIQNVFDLQAAHRHIEMKKTLCANLKSLSDLCEAYSVKINGNLKAEIKEHMKRNEFFWTTRPLTDEMVRYASQDVLVLFELYHAIHHKLTEDDLKQIRDKTSSTLESSRQDGLGNKKKKHKAR